MTRGRVVAGVALLASVAVAGCTSSNAPNWSFAAPASSPAPGASAAPSAPAPSTIPASQAPASPAASAGASAVTGSPAASSSAAPAPSGATLNLVAKNIAYDQSSLSVAANTPFTIHFDNQDAGVPHDVAIHQGSASGQQLFQGQIVTGPASVDYQIGPLPAGTYTLICVVHPQQMVATLTVK